MIFPAGTFKNFCLDFKIKLKSIEGFFKVESTKNLQKTGITICFRLSRWLSHKLNIGNAHKKQILQLIEEKLCNIVNAMHVPFNQVC